jgi:hypothetical protein
MIADHLTTKIHDWGTDRRTVQVWRRHDNQYRVVELHRIGESSRYREARGETCKNFDDALRFAREWQGES